MRGTGEYGGRQSQNQRRFHRVIEAYLSLRKSSIKPWHNKTNNNPFADALDFCCDVDLKAKRAGIQMSAVNTEAPPAVQERLGEAWINLDYNGAYRSLYSVLDARTRDSQRDDTEPVTHPVAETEIEPEMLEGGYPSASDIVEATLPLSEWDLTGEETYED